MTIYITGDTHGESNPIKLRSVNFPNYNNCTKDDILIIAGDFSYVFQNENNSVKIKKESNNLKHIFENRKFGDTLFVDGNHENFDRLDKFPTEEKYGGKVKKISNSVYQLLRGEIYSINGIKILTFGGAKSTDRKDRIIGVDWWPQEIFSEEEMENAFKNLEKNNYEVDYIITHTCSSSILQKLCNKYNMNIRAFDKHNKLFEDFKQKVKYKKWYFGHMHIDSDITEKDICLYNKVIELGKNIYDK